jgi:hypothetical protein
MLLTWRVQSRVPVIGGKVERLFADQVRNALEADHAFTLQNLMAIASKLTAGSLESARCGAARTAFAFLSAHCGRSSGDAQWALARPTPGQLGGSRTE